MRPSRGDASPATPRIAAAARTAGTSNVTTSAGLFGCAKPRERRASLSGTPDG